jgi:hypothetical protein
VSWSAFWEFMAINRRFTVTLDFAINRSETNEKSMTIEHVVFLRVRDEHAHRLLQEKLEMIKLTSHRIVLDLQLKPLASSEWSLLRQTFMDLKSKIPGIDELSIGENISPARSFGKRAVGFQALCRCEDGGSTRFRFRIHSCPACCVC